MAELKLPVKLGYAITCNIEKLREEVSRLEKQREKLCQRYADRGADGKPALVPAVINGEEVKQYKFSEENRALFNEEYEALYDMQIDVHIRTVKEDILEQCDRINRYDTLSVAQMMALAFMLE